MKIQYQLWLILSALFLILSLGIYAVVGSAYQERLQSGYEQIAVTQGLAILDELTKAYPASPKRSSGYLQKYGRQLQCRLILLNAEKKVFADSFNELATNTALNLAVLREERQVSYFLQTSFGYLQYTLLPFTKAEGQGYLLMIQPAASLEAQLHAFRLWMLQAILLSLLLCFLLSYAVSAWLTEPIRKIIAALKQITPHRRSFTLTYRRRDEIKELIVAIKKMVAELNFYDENQKRFLSMSSHELKTPLATMQLILENLPYVRQDEEKFQEFTADLSFQIKKMKQMVEQLLLMTKIHGITLQKQALSAQEVQEHLWQSFQHLAEEKQVSLKFALEQTTFYADKLLFFQALDNLVANAIRYSPPGKQVKIMLKTTGNFHLFSICDQGIGIAEKDLPHIFTPFYRADDATAWNQEGSGLGLSIAKQIAELHQGKLTVDTVWQKGTCFHLQLPRESNKNVTLNQSS